MPIKETVTKKLNWLKLFFIFLILLFIFIGGIKLMTLHIIGNIVFAVFIIFDVVILWKWDDISEKLSKNKVIKAIGSFIVGEKPPEE